MVINKHFFKILRQILNIHMTSIILTSSTVTVCSELSLHLTLRKIAIWMSKNCQKLDIFFKKIDKNCHFFQQNCHWQFCLSIFLKKRQFSGNFLTFKWQFSGGSDRDLEGPGSHILTVRIFYEMIQCPWLIVQQAFPVVFE